MHAHRQRIIDERFELHFDGTVGNVADVCNTHFHMRFEAGNGIGLALFEKVPGCKTRPCEQQNNDNQFKWLPFLHGVSWLIPRLFQKAFPLLLCPRHTYMCTNLFTNSVKFSDGHVFPFGTDF